MGRNKVVNEESSWSIKPKILEEETTISNHALFYIYYNGFFLTVVYLTLS